MTNQNLLENLIDNLKDIGKKTYKTTKEGLYNEYSLTNELINHIQHHPVISKDEWIKHFYKWLDYVRDDIDRIMEDDDDLEDEWMRYLETFLDRMDLIFDYAEIIFR